MTPPQLVPGEVATRAGSALYADYNEQDALSKPYWLPDKFFQGIRPEAGALPDAPLIVFINARSGGRSGPSLALALSRALGRVQVFDLSVYKPDLVLTKLWANFQASVANGVPNAASYQSRLRILVAGGDGTITWVLATIKALKLHPIPPVAVMPLGTGNDLSRSFGWGPAFDSAWIKGFKGVYNTLKRISAARIEDLDCWKIKITLPRADLLGRLPHCLKASHVSNSAPPPANTPRDGPQPPAEGPGGGTGEGTAPPAAVAASGLFWNYVSVGLDARAAFNFHDLREESPHLASHRIANQFWYSWFSCTSGWFCCTKPLSAKVQLSVQRPGFDEWVQVQVPDNVKALVVLNLQSYAGGRNLWGPHDPSDDAPSVTGTQAQPFREPSHNDGLLEVVGLTSGWHTGAVMASKGALVHAMRLTQASGVRLALRAKHVRPDGTPSHAYLQIDGEPWCQDVPSCKEDASVMVEIRHAGVSKVLRNYGELGRTSSAPVAMTVMPRPGGAHPPPGVAGSEPDGAVPASAVPNSFRTPHGTVIDSEAVQVGSERASSIRSGNSWATSMAVSTRMEAGQSTGTYGQAGTSPLPGGHE